MYLSRNGDCGTPGNIMVAENFEFACFFSTNTREQTNMEEDSGMPQSFAEEGSKLGLGVFLWAFVARPQGRSKVTAFLFFFSFWQLQ